MFTLAHLSDIHLSPFPAPSPWQLANKRILGLLSWQGGRSKNHSKRILDSLVADLAAQSVSHTVMTGDLINLSLPDEFAAASDWLRRLGSPTAFSVVPGNHDAYVPVAHDAGLSHWQANMSCNEAGSVFCGGVGGPFPYVRIFDRVAIVGVSSAIPTGWFIHAGRVGTEQLRSLETILHRLREQGFFRVVLIHHPPIHLTRRKQAQLGLWDVGAFREVIKQFGAELVLHGHLHTNTKSYVETTDGRAVIVGVPSASVGSHKRKPLARYNLYRISTDAGGWRCDMIGRGLRRGDDAGEIVELERCVLLGATN